MEAWDLAPIKRSCGTDENFGVSLIGGSRGDDGFGNTSRSLS
jgi:hypothetical protein